MSHRSVLVASLSMSVLLAGGCNSRPARSLHSQRNLACLHAFRDTDEGYQAAIDILQGVVKTESAGFVDWLNLARAQVLHSKRVAGAAATLAKARAIGADDRGMAALNYVTGLQLKSTQSYGEAYEAFAQVLLVLPEHPEALYQCAFAAEKARKFDVAKQHFQLLVDLEQLLRPAAYRLSRVAMMTKDKATETAATAIFKAQDKDQKPEVTKCDLTDLALRRFNRARVEPKRVDLAWVEAKQVPSSGVVHQVLSCPGASSTDIDLFLVGDSELLLSHNGAAATSTGVSLHGRACGVVLDLDNKLGAEVVVADDRGFTALRHDVDGNWRPVKVGFPPAHQGRAPVAMAAFDFDHDGDVDVLVGTAGLAGRLLVLRNNGDQGFAWQEPFQLGFGISGQVGRIDAHDLDQANDLDLLCPDGERGVTVLLNLRGGKYRPVVLPELAGRDLLIAEDFDGDGAPDLFAAGGKPGWDFLANADSGGRHYQLRFRAADTAPSGAPVFLDAVPGDIDNDGDLDVLLASSGGLTVLRNQAGVLRADPMVPIPGGLRRVSVVDLGSDGVLDLVGIDGESRLVIHTPQPTAAYQAVWVVPVGRKDNRRAIGTIVKVYAGRTFQSRMIKSVTGLHLGLGPGGLDSLDGLRLRWPQGILQAMPRSSFKQLAPRLEFKQIEGLVASCPFLYSCGENGWEFLTDVVGIAPLDEWLPPGSDPVPLDPEEYVRIRGDRLVVQGGRVQLAITEELKETTYLDRVELYYLDHTEETELLLNENIVTQGKYDPLQVQRFAREQFAPLAKAMVRGVDHAAKLHRLDGEYLHPYLESKSQWGGWTRPHVMELTTSAVASVLLMEGRIAWYDSTVSYALHQNGRSFAPMKMERIDANGEAELLIADVGIPTGMDRTMIVPLGQTPLPAGTRLRFTAQYRFLWDRIRTATAPRLASARVGRASLANAELYHHGYSAYIGDPGSHQQRYDFARAAPDDRYPRAKGLVNPYGDVKALLEAHDDRLVIIVAGDAVKFEFAAPAVPAGKRRTWFFKITGWAKEGSFHNTTGKRILPLPFQAMSAYPPPSGEHTPWRDTDQLLTRRIR